MTQKLHSQVHTARKRRRRLGFSPVRLYRPSNRDLWAGVRQPLTYFLLVLWPHCPVREGLSKLKQWCSLAPLSSLSARSPRSSSPTNAKWTRLRNQICTFPSPMLWPGEKAWRRRVLPAHSLTQLAGWPTWMILLPCPATPAASIARTASAGRLSMPKWAALAGRCAGAFGGQTRQEATEYRVRRGGQGHGSLCV